MGVGRARVLVVDDDERVGRHLKARLNSKEFEVFAAEGTGQVLMESARLAAAAFRPHVAVVDLQLSERTSHAPDGFQLMRGLRSAGCVLYSGHLNIGVTDEASRQFGCQVVDKGEDPPSKLVDAITSAAQQVCGFRQPFAVQYPPDWQRPRIIETLFGGPSEVPEDIVDTIVWQLFRQLYGESMFVQKVRLETLEGSVRSVHSVSRGRSAIFKAYREGRIRPVFLKLAAARSVEREFCNYRQHVEDNIEGEFYAVVRSEPVVFWDIGGLAYKFLGGETEQLQDLATFYATADTAEHVLAPLRHFFGTAWRSLYTNSSECGRPLFDVYDSTLHLSARLEAVEHLPERIDVPGLNGIGLPHPVAWVQRHSGSSYIHTARLASTHGDLHAGNLLVDREHAWAIDFERAGPGHWLRDFAELEVDILTRLAEFPDQEDFSGLCEAAVILAEPRALNARLYPLPQRSNTGGLGMALEIISGLRRIAHRTVNCTDFREYLWALLLDAVFVAMLPAEGSEQYRSALVLGGVLCDRLEHWRGSWPLRERVLSF
jgi:ActR/RegA family two-component response regulator